MSANFDDSIITDTAVEKQQNMAEVAAGLMQPEEYRVEWYGESEGVEGTTRGYHSYRKGSN
ncbi:hypothetical protein [Collinsella sp. An271]|uniref:hypothetical protein n=1 Tax=Collinsella sp. An271 TaxID=1965616 RepID=UPI001EF5D789|nr:hypothetical protein [Collinsella sp. An271]